MRALTGVTGGSNAKTKTDAVDTNMANGTCLFNDSPWARCSGSTSMLPKGHSIERGHINVHGAGAHVSGFRRSEARSRSGHIKWIVQRIVQHSRTSKLIWLLFGPALVSKPWKESYCYCVHSILLPPSLVVLQRGVHGPRILPAVSMSDVEAQGRYTILPKLGTF